ncbi:MAG: 50S ribosomal protein L9 [Alphaproteobacteria bacterium]|nr:50S ribosomal protein L9 [Alphaproteobacteria bacterium]
MQVILLERVEKLGQMGDVVSVRDGYARNFLLPQKKALRATKDNVAAFEAHKVQLEAQNLERRKEAEAVAKKMDGLAVIVLRQASETGQLYGSVSARDVADAISEAGFTIARRQVQLQSTFKTVGLSKVPVALHPEVVVSVTVNVARSKDEADAQAAGKSIVGAAAQEAQEATQFFEEDVAAKLAVPDAAATAPAAAPEPIEEAAAPKKGKKKGKKAE